MLDGMAFRWLTVFLDFPADSFDAGVAFWREATGSGLSSFRGAAGEFATLLPPAGDAYLRVQRTMDGSGGHHLDLHVHPADGTLEGAAALAISLGARMRDREDEEVIVLDSPGGFTFCLVRGDGETAVPAPSRMDGAGTSRADQLCLDIPPAVFERECSFWAALTGWEMGSGSRPEFAYLRRPAGIPVRLLLQRLDGAAADDRVTAHVDFACADRDQLADLHVARGARVAGTFPFWTVMADPTGRQYCLTKRDPETGHVPTV
jgi:glyoxalase superfamily protein